MAKYILLVKDYEFWKNLSSIEIATEKKKHRKVSSFTTAIISVNGRSLDLKDKALRHPHLNLGELMALAVRANTVLFCSK